jgi:hypothetical protein
MEPIVEACSNWWDQQLNPSCQLWGISVLWWGRVGKLLSAAGLAAVIVEIIGPKKLGEWGNELGKWSQALKSPYMPVAWSCFVTPSG